MVLTSLQAQHDGTLLRWDIEVHTTHHTIISDPLKGLVHHVLTFCKHCRVFGSYRLDISPHGMVNLRGSATAFTCVHMSVLRKTDTTRSSMRRCFSLSISTLNQSNLYTFIAEKETSRSNLMEHAGSSVLADMRRWATEFRSVCLDCPVGAARLARPENDPRRPLFTF